MSLAIQGKKLVDTETGEILSPDISPRFSNLTYDDYVNAFPNIRHITPMKAEAVTAKEAPTKKTFGEQKFDGFRGLAYFTKDAVRMFTYNISKDTGWFGEYTDNVPHIRDIALSYPDLEGTVLDVEFVMPTGLFKDVSGVAGSKTLVETAINNQIEKGLGQLKCFDVLYYKGLRIENYHLFCRKTYLAKIIDTLNSPFFQFSSMYYVDLSIRDMFSPKDVIELTEKGRLVKINSYVESANDMWAKGFEGIMVKDACSIYEQKRAKTWMKVKEMHYKDVFIMGYNAPTKTFEAEERKTRMENWEYWEGDTPVTKPYAKGWIGSIIVGVLDENGKEVKVADVKGLSDEMLEYIKEKGDSLIGTVIEIKFNGWNDETKLTARHPRYSKDRSVEKVKEDCTWESWVKS